MPGGNYPVRDHECYDERESIGLDAWISDGKSWHHMLPYQNANEAAHRTLYSIVTTAAYRGDWVPAWRWCAVICERFGDETAAELMQDIRAQIETERKWRNQFSQR